MREFFKPWRRRIGIVLLVMACVFSVGWVRSRNVFDRITWDFDCFGFGSLSTDEMLIVGFWVDDKPFQLQWPEMLSANFSYFEERSKMIDWGVTLTGFQIGTIKTQHATSYFLAVAYPFLLVPFTVLSAWLLLFTPRQTNSKTVIEPMPETVA